jgi:hypothetical protein
LVVLPADISTNAENNAISSSVRCIEHKLFPNSNTKLIKSSQPAKMKIKMFLRFWLLSYERTMEQGDERASS